MIATATSSTALALTRLVRCCRTHLLRPWKGASMDLRPVGRWEWERVVRRITSLPEHSKYLALLMATWADPDGSRVRPGERVLAKVIGKDERTVRRRLDPLLAGGLLQLVARGGGRGGAGRTAVYRLTLPVDLFDRHRLLGPDYEDTDEPTDSPDTQVSGGSGDSPDTQAPGQSDPPPVDSSDSPDTLVPAQSRVDEPIDRTNNDVTDRLTGHLEPIDRTPECPTTRTDQPPKETNQLGHLPTQPPTAREQPPGPRRCGHGLAAGRRPDGTPRCALCRRDAIQNAPPLPVAAGVP